MSEDRSGTTRDPSRAGDAGLRPELRPARAVRLLVADPELGEGLSADEFERARKQVVVPAIDAPAGPLDIEGLRRLPGIRGELYGFLVVKGTLMVNLHMAGRQCGRLVSIGGLVLLDGDVTETIPAEVDWVVVDACRLACFDERLLEIVLRWPPLMAPIMSRAAQYARYALMQQAISQLPKVEDRLLALFWSLADRQGVVRSDGIWVALSTTHDTLAHLVGAQRPTVSLGLSRLAESGLLRAQPGGWLINPDSFGAFGLSEPGSG